MDAARVWVGKIDIPTYEIGQPEKNPLFLDKRVYQGSCGKVYPYPAIEKISGERHDRTYTAVWLENEYLKVMVLPELGGRIQRALDKTNGYDFVYYNHVIKPALVGLTGPWISGGIEFNWPQHHRPTTFLPVDYDICQEDGCAAVLLHDVDQMYGTKSLTKIALYPGKAYIEITGQLYNRTPMPQTFLWWANPAVAVNENTQSIFPPDVHAVMDHGKRDVSRFPIATGVYTDNQPDFSWLKPFEEKVFRQYFMPYKAVGQVKNATTSAAVHLSLADGAAKIIVYGTQVFENARVVLTVKGRQVLEERTRLSPTDVFETAVPVGAVREEDCRVAVYDGDGTCLVAYQPEKPAIPRLPEPAKAAKDPSEYRTNEELLLTGRHIEQYRHATYRPDPYYREALKRDPGDIRVNNAYGSLLMGRGLFGEAEGYFRKALERLTERNPNPYNSETYCLLGLDLFRQGRDEEAYDAFYKAAWTSEQQEMSYYYLAVIDARRGQFGQALEHVERALVKNAHSVKARGLKAYLLRKLGRTERAARWISENLDLDPFDFVSGWEAVILGLRDGAALGAKMRGFRENYLMTARDYGEFGAYAEARDVLAGCGEDYPMLRYYDAFYAHALGLTDQVGPLLEAAEAAPTDYCFPNKPEDIAVLRFAMDRGCRARAPYYLGCLYYDKLQWRKALELWETAAGERPDFPTVWRNLSLVYFNKLRDPDRAREAMERAFRLDETDGRVFFELDQLYKKLGWSFEDRLANMEAHRELAESRDDLFIEYITLVNLCGDHERALGLILSHSFHPWEGGEGKVTAQYTLALLELARAALGGGRFPEAEALLRRALVYPENLGEGKLEGTKDNHIYYHLGLTLEGQGRTEEARACYERAAAGTDEPAGALYYNDQPADMILYQGLSYQKLGDVPAARSRFYRLIDYGERHLEDEGRIGYFAVSLPDFLIFDEDYTRKNRAHCNYLMALGHMGLGDRERAAAFLDRAISLEPSHMMCRVYKDIPAGLADVLFGR